MSDVFFEKDPEYCLEITDYTQHLALRIGDTRSLIESSNKLALIQKELGFMNLAQKTVSENIERSENKGDPKLMGDSRLVAGHVFMALEEYSSARGDYQKALKYYGEAGDTAGMAYAYEGAGTVNAALNQHARALKSYEKAEKDWSREDLAGRANLWTDMGISYTKLEDFKPAEKYFNKSLAYYQKQGEFSGQVRVNYNLGLLYMKKKEVFEAESAFINCVDIGKRRKRSKDVLLGYHGLYELNKAEGKFQQALIYHEKYTDLEKTVREEEGQVSEGLEKYYISDANLEAINRQDSFYARKFKNESEEKQLLWIAVLVAGIMLVGFFVLFLKIRKKNRILLLQKRDIESKNDEIDVSLREKDLLLKEVHHRVKNNLQLISSLLNLQRHKISDEGTLVVLSESINRIQSISLIHQKFYQSSNLAKVDFKNYLTDLVESQKRLYGNPDRPVRTTVMGKNHFLGLDTAVPLGLIITELITNAFKHAFHLEANPELSIRVDTDDYLTITVKDNGSGLPPGFSIKNSESLGMEIVEALSEQLYGHVSYHNDHGAVFVVKVKELSGNVD